MRVNHHPNTYRVQALYIGNHHIWALQPVAVDMHRDGTIDLRCPTNLFPIQSNIRAVGATSAGRHY